MPKKSAKVKKSKKDMSQEELSRLLKKSLEESELKERSEEFEGGLDDIDVTGLEFHPLLNRTETKAPVLETIAGDGSVATPIFVSRARTGNVEDDSEIKYESVGKEDSKYSSSGHEYESPNIREASNAKDFSATREVSMDTSLNESRRNRWAAEETFAPERIRDQRNPGFEGQSQEKKYKEPKHKKL